jgi:glycosyltransferase involved in cell wall biosynthesis
VMIDISVIIPVYNSKEYLHVCLDSVLTQTISNIEVICIDDCSTDNSLTVLEYYATHDSRVTVFRAERNGGSGIARNIGLSRSTGQYVTFCDADDAYPPNALKLLHDAAVSTDADFSVGNISIMDATLSCIFSLSQHMAAMRIESRQIGKLMDIPALWIPYFHQRFLLRREYLLKNKIRYPDLMRGQDPPMLARTVCLAQRAIVIPDVVYRYRTHGKNRINSDQKLAEHLSHIDMVVKIFKEYKFDKQAAIYIYFSATEFSGLGIFIRFTYMQRKKIINYFTELFEYENRKYCFAPYTIDQTMIKKKFELLHKGCIIYGLSFIYHKLNQVISQKYSA